MARNWKIEVKRGGRPVRLSATQQASLKRRVKAILRGIGVNPLAGSLPWMRFIPDRPGGTARPSPAKHRRK